MRKPMTMVASVAADFVGRFQEYWSAPTPTATVHRWGATEDGVLIEFTVDGTAGGRPISWDAVDRFVLDGDGLATERISYFDSVPVALAVAARPKAWPDFARVQLARLRRS